MGLDNPDHRWLGRILHVSWKGKIPNKKIRERTGQELGCIIGRRRLGWLGHVARMNKYRRAKRVMNWDLGGKWQDQGRIGLRPSVKTCKD